MGMEKGAANIFLRTWNRLVEPHKSITGFEDQSGAKLFASLMIIHVLVVVAALTGINVVTVHYQDHHICLDRDTWIVAAGAGLIIASYLVLKAGYYYPAVIFYIAITAIVPLTGPFSGDPNADIGLLTIALTPTLLASYIFRLRWVTAILIFMLAAMTWQLTHTPLPPRIVGTGFSIMLSIMVCSGLTVVFRHRYRVLEKSRMERIRENELALQRTTERLRVLLGNSMDILMGIDRNSIVIFIGGAFESTTGYSVDRSLGHPIYDLIHREDLDRVMDEIEGLKAFPGKSIRSEWRQIHDKGQVQWFEALLTNRLGQPGLDNIVINLREVTERRAAEELLHQSELKYRNLFETVSDGIFIADDLGNILEVNKGACRMLGYSHAELLARNLRDIASNQDMLENLKKDLLAGNMGPHEVENTRKDGTVIPVDLSVSTIIYEGRFAFLGVARDISERNKAQAERKSLEDRIQQSARMETVGRLAGGVAHDFNNLLTIILGHAEILDGELGETHPQNGRLKDIRAAGKNAAILVQQLLAFSRKETLAPRILNLNEQISSVTRILKGLIGENITVEFRPDPGIDSVRIDPGVVERTIINLAVNARDAMPDGGTLSITTKPGETGANQGASREKYVKITVTDTGSGMTEETKSHIFEPFFTTKPRSHGTGLGLATVYGAITQADGFIDVESAPGKGTTFTVYLPAVKEKPESRNRAPNSGSLPRGSETILYAEDEDAVRDFTSRMIESFGYTVLAAASGNIALEIAENHAGPIHLFFTDTIMPGMNGRQTAEKIVQAHPETRVLFTSGYSADILSLSGVVDEGIDFLPKPYSRQDLANRIRAKLDAKTA
jgi:PAS domain S-box-containing protein